ncbi:MAG TPA: MlaD family protein [Thermoleophilaceae bacterium]|nr:MlaD family protein [Thermoleophilaceae bacterium]
MTQRTDETPGAAAGQPASPAAAKSRGPGRLLAAGALAFALIALLAIWVTRDDAHEYKLVFDNAGQMVKGDVVRVGGTAVGEVNAIELTDDGQAELTVSVADEFAPLHSGTTATIRWQGLIGTANRYVDISPAPNFKDELADGATIESDKTESIVEIDQFFNTFTPKTREGLDHFIQGFADWYAGQETKANASAKYFPPALSQATKLFNELNRDSEDFQSLLVETSKAMGALEQRSGDITDWVDNTGTTLAALSADTESLNQVLTDLPPALRQGSKTFASLRGPAIDDLERFVVESEPSAKVLPSFLRRFRTLTAESVPVFTELSKMFNGPGAGNDLYDTMVDLPPLARMADKAFPRAQKSLKDSTPIWGFIRPYAPDLSAWLRSFGGAMAPYDANGHYARTIPVFDAFNFTDDDEGGSLTPKPPAERGSSPYLSTGNLRRCPGAGAPAAADGSAPFVDMGELANPDCDPSQVLGGTP